MDWNGNAEGNNRTEALVNRLVWDNGYSQSVDSQPEGTQYWMCTWSDLTVHLPQATSIVQGISDHHGGMLQVDWEENSIVLQAERLIAVYYKTDAVGLQTFLRDRFSVWASNGSSVE